MTALVIPQDGERFIGENPQVPRIYRQTIGAAAGQGVLLDAQETQGVFAIPAGYFVDWVAIKITTAWTASVTLTMGDGDDVDGWLTNALSAPQTDDDTLGIFAKSVGQDTIYALGKFYAAADNIDIVAAGATPAAGVAEAYCQVWQPALAA